MLLYGCENWILCEQDILLLEKFQDDMGKRMLKLPRHHTNAITRVVLDLPSIRCRILIRKLKFLANLLTNNDETIGATSFRALAMVDVYDISLIQQCLFLEDHLSIKAVQACLRVPDMAATAKDYTKQLLTIDSNLSFEEADGHPSLKHILEVKERVSWLKVFDMALDHGSNGTQAVQNILKMLYVPLFGDRVCRHCGTHITREVTYAEHVTVCPSCNVTLTIPDIINALVTFSEVLFQGSNELYWLK